MLLEGNERIALSPDRCRPRSNLHELGMEGYENLAKRTENVLGSDTAGYSRHVQALLTRDLGRRGEHRQQVRIGRRASIGVDERHQDAPLRAGQMLLCQEASLLPLRGNTREQREETCLIIACERVARWEEWLKGRKHAIHRRPLFPSPPHRRQAPVSPGA